MADTLHVIRDLDPGGAQTQLLLLAAAARARGDRVAVASLRRPGSVGERLRAAGVEVGWLGRRYSADPFVCRRVARRLEEGRFATVLTWDTPSGGHVGVARRLRRPDAVWLHAVRETAAADRLASWVRREADRIVTPSETIARSLVDADPGAASRVRLVPNAVGPPDSSRVDRRAVLGRLGFPAETKLIAAATRFDKARHAKELVWAADLVRVVRPETRLVLVGDGPARRRVERFARGAAEPGLVTFTGEIDDWSGVLAAADVVWCASASPDGPTPLVEAIAARKPIVASAAPGRERWIVDGETGWLTDWNDRASWARPTVRLLEDEAIGQRVAEAARPRTVASSDDAVAALDEATAA